MATDHKGNLLQPLTDTDKGTTTSLHLQMLDRLLTQDSLRLLIIEMLNKMQLTSAASQIIETAATTDSLVPKTKATQIKEHQTTPIIGLGHQVLQE